MELLGTGTPKGEEKAFAGLRGWNFVVNVRAGTADLPGDSSVEMVYTRARDVAKFVAAVVRLEKWEEEMGMVGKRRPTVRL